MYGRAIFARLFIPKWILLRICHKMLLLLVFCLEFYDSFNSSHKFWGMELLCDSEAGSLEEIATLIGYVLRNIFLKYQGCIFFKTLKTLPITSFEKLPPKTQRKYIEIFPKREDFLPLKQEGTNFFPRIYPLPHPVPLSCSFSSLFALYFSKFLKASPV